MNRGRNKQLLAQHGVSLIEALVALAVMAFGLLGVVGMQATLRGNGDVSKQRSEAVRMAQEQIEDWRAFEKLAVTPGPPPVASFADIDAIGGVSVTGYATNATYTRSATVVDTTTGPYDPKLKFTRVEVSWRDRADNIASVQLVSAIAGVAPELAGSLSLPGDRAATQRPNKRHFAIPAGAVSQSDGVTSVFAPSDAAPNLRWIFNNQSGFITRVCTEVLNSCLDTTLLPLSGFVQFATGTMQPSGFDAETPSSAAEAITVQVNTTIPTIATTACYTQPFPTYVAYFCGMPLTTTLPRRWSGRTHILGLQLSLSIADASPTNRKVCRYTPTTVTSGVVNRNHPLDYVDVTEPLTNQNFLVIRGGNGGTARFLCPDDDASTPFVDGNTDPQQPDA